MGSSQRGNEYSEFCVLLKRALIFSLFCITCNLSANYTKAVTLMLFIILKGNS
jgi:hypothetical protein